MRIVHFSDFHLSSENYQYFKTVYIHALIGDMKSQSEDNPFDLIIISGDLVDKGGHSLYKIREYVGREKEITPFEIFKELFIDKIASELSIPQNNFLFVPGNHDIDENGILLKEESDLVNMILAKGNNDVTDIMELNEENFKYSLRTKGFKKFEAKFHANQTDKYIYSHNQSVYKFEDTYGNKYGFLLLNDSWRCKSVPLAIEKESSFKLNLGSKQIYDGLDILRGFNPDVIICVMHHPIDKFNDKEEIEGIFITEDLDVVLFGDLHQTHFNVPSSINGKYISSQCKASFSNHNEMNINYLCGYQILELDKTMLSSISFRYYDGRSNQKRFLPDVSMGDDGTGIFRGLDKQGFPFYKKSKPDFNDITNFKN